MTVLRFSSKGLRRCAVAVGILAGTVACAEGSNPQPSGLVSSGGSTAGASGSSALAGGSGTGAGQGSGGQGSGGQGSGGQGSGAGTPLNQPWDWAGIVGTGQSLAVGDNGSARGTADAAVKATTQPFQNLKLSTGNAAWPVDPNDASLQLVPLVEPVGRRAMGYPSSWPTNISGETPHAAMANQITALVQAAGGGDYVSVHGEVGENGQCLSFLVKGALPVDAMDVRAHAYEATLIETRAITRLAQAAGKTYGVGAIIVTHGECDNGTVDYAAKLHALWSDYAKDLSAITGQTHPPLLIVSQQNSQSDRSVSTLEQRRVGVDYPADAVCSGPKYQYPYAPDGIHLLVTGYEQLGEKYAQVYYERVVRGIDWRPLEPTAVQRSGRVIHVDFHVPVPPLVWEDTFQAPHQTTLGEWSMGKGFEVRGGAGNIAISSVEIAGNGVDITCATDLPATGVSVGYALTGDGTLMTSPFAGTKHWGLLRDSDPLVGSTSQKPQPNFAVAFELPVPNG